MSPSNSNLVYSGIFYHQKSAVITKNRTNVAMLLSAILSAIATLLYFQYIFSILMLTIFSRRVQDVMRSLCF